MNMRSLMAVSAAVVLAASCGSNGKKEEQAQAEKVDAIVSQVQEINEKMPAMEPMVLQVTGYGAINAATRGVTEVQKRLLAMRASKLDAYRTLAERVYGTKIIGNSTVENLVVQNDKYRAFVDANILGANVIYQEMMPDGSYETMVEMIIDEGFRNCLASQSDGRANTTCASDAVHDLDSLSRSSLSAQGVSSTGSGLYFIE